MDLNSQVLWRLQQRGHEVRCEVKSAPAGAPAGNFLLLFVDDRLVNRGFHTTQRSLIETAIDLVGALRNIVWDMDDEPGRCVRRGDEIEAIGA